MKNISPTPKFQLIGHRGVAGLRPENTLCGFEYAAALGLNWVEFDVQLTKDKQWVVMHDEKIDRTTNGEGLVQTLTLKQIQQFEAGLWFRPPYPKQMVPSLLQALELCKHLGLQANVEIKLEAHDNPLHYAEMMALFLRENFADDVPLPLISSFNLQCVIALRKLRNDLMIAYLVDCFTPDTINLAREHDFNSICCDVAQINEQDISAAAAFDLPVMLYTINDPIVAKIWLQNGAAAIFTDRPDLLQIDN